MILDDALFNTQHYMVRINGKVSNPENGVAPSLTPWLVTIEKGVFVSPSNKVTNITYLTVCKEVSSNSFKNVINNIYLEIIYYINE